MMKMSRSWCRVLVATGNTIGLNSNSSSPSCCGTAGPATTTTAGAFVYRRRARGRQYALRACRFRTERSRSPSRDGDVVAPVS